MSDLLPCPFCGGSTHIADTGLQWVVCNACSAEGPPADTQQEAIAKWNNRVIIQPQRTADARDAIAAQLCLMFSSHPGLSWADSPEARKEAWRRYADQVIAAMGPPSGAATNFLPNLIDWAFLYATEGHVWPSSDTASRLIGLARSKPATQADADAFKNGACLSELAVTRPERQGGGQ